MDPCPRAFLTFGDSSGNPSRSKRGYEDSTHYVIATAMMDMREAHKLDAEVEALKRKYFKKLKLERVSFHGNQLLHNLIRYTGNRRRAEEKFKGVCADIVKIAQNTNATINLVIMNKQFPREDYSTMSTVVASWAQASDMIRQNMLNLCPDAIGAILLDRYDDSTNRIVARTLTRFLEPPTNSGNPAVPKIIPRPIFVYSTTCNTIQLVDMIAFIVSGDIRHAPPGMFKNLRAQLQPHISHSPHHSRIARFLERAMLVLGHYQTPTHWCLRVTVFMCLPGLPLLVY